MKSAFGYCRVSSVSQSTEERAVPRQKVAINKWAAANGVEIVRWFEDAISGTKESKIALPCRN